MNWNHGIRQFHRWVSVAFTLAVVATSVALVQKEPVVWMSYLPLGPLFLLFVSGAYLFVRPYLGRATGRTPPPPTSPSAADAPHPPKRPTA